MLAIALPTVEADRRPLCNRDGYSRILSVTECSVFSL